METVPGRLRTQFSAVRTLTLRTSLLAAFLGPAPPKSRSPQRQHQPDDSRQKGCTILDDRLVLARWGCWNAIHIHVILRPSILGRSVVDDPEDIGHPSTADDARQPQEDKRHPAMFRLIRMSLTAPAPP